MKSKLSLLVVVLMLLPLLPAQAQPIPPIAGPNPASLESAGLPTDQVIIRYKTSANLYGSNAPDSADRMSALSAVAGVQVEYFREMSSGSHVLKLPGRLPLAQVELIAKRLMTLGDVEYAQPDYILQPTLTPNDSMYGQQWHYFETYGINAPAAWDITTGSSNIVVAVIDTGILNHADLAGRTVPGYDFISDTWTANDGGGRDSDPSDPGDWTAANDCYSGWPGSNSSWHGTHVAGTIGAASNNSTGVAGINWVSKILPVRVLGKCGGVTSDITDGMRWAAGLSVSGVPANANPAKVLNMSLGGHRSSPPYCDTETQNAINAITAAGASVIVAAGNDHVDASQYSPASCNGVVTVAATNRDGNRASYSNFGSVVEISAPGGETAVSGNGVLSTLNTGTQGPVADTYAFYQGTSMATPHVVGVASLLLSVNPSLTPAQVLQVLQSTAKPFPGGSSCNTSICGSGIVDAGAAVRAVAYDVGIQKQVLGSDLKPGDRVTFTLSIANTGGVTATNIVVTDIVPVQVLTPTFASNLTITRTGVLTYVWSVGSLGVGKSGVITIYGRIDPSLPSDLSFTNSASISAQQDYVSSNNTSSATVGGSKVFLPIVLKSWVPTPGFWQDTTYGDEFYVSSDNATVYNFAIYVNVTGCGTLKITRTIAAPISSRSFSFSGTFYASGTFDSATSAHGIDGLNNYYSTTCSAYLNGGPWDWTATWQHSLTSGPAAQPVDGAITETLVDADQAHQVERMP